MIKIAFLGKMHSGKTTALDKIWQLAEKQNLIPKLVKFAEPLYKSQENFIGYEAKKNRIFLQELSSLSKKCFGEDILSVIFENTVKKFETTPPVKWASTTTDYGDKYVLLCDDIRVPSDLATAKKCGFVTIGIDASDEVRRQRNPKLFVGTTHETETQVDALMPLVDIAVDGNLHIDKFRDAIEIIWRNQINV